LNLTTVFHEKRPPQFEVHYNCLQRTH